MTEKLDEKSAHERQVYLAALKRHVARLHKMLSYPDARSEIKPVNVLFLKGVLHAAMAYAGDELRVQFFRQMDTQYRQYYGLCIGCGGDLAGSKDSEFCLTCVAEFEAEDREAQLAELAEAQPHGETPS